MGIAITLSISSIIIVHLICEYRKDIKKLERYYKNGGKPVVKEN